MELELRDILRILKRGWQILILLPLLAMLTSGALSFYVITPIYVASTTLMVGNNYNEEKISQIKANDILAASQLVSSYIQIAKSRTVAENVVKIARLKITPAELINKTSVQPMGESQLIKITIEDSNPKEAAHLANVTGDVFMKKVAEIIEINNIRIVDLAEPPKAPAKPNKERNIINAGLAGLMVAAGLAFLLDYLEQSSKNREKDGACLRDNNNRVGSEVEGTVVQS